MTIGSCLSLRAFAQRIGAILSSYKIAILAVASWLVFGGYLDDVYWFRLAVLIISARAFESIVRVWPVVPRNGSPGEAP